MTSRRAWAGRGRGRIALENAIVQLLRERYATRAIDTTPLSDEIIVQLSEAVRLTPSCNNNQPWRYLFLLSDEARAKGGECLSKGNFPWAGRAPLLVIGYSSEADDCVNSDGRRYFQFGLGLSTMNLMLAATALRLVARPMAGFDPAKVKELFGLPEAAQPLVMVAIGYPTDDESHLPENKKGLGKLPRVRKPVEEIIRRL
jgi:nitroreductase